MTTRIIAELKIVNTVVGKPVTLVFTRNEEDVMNTEAPAAQGVKMEVAEGDLGLAGFAVEDLTRKLVAPIAELHHWKSW